MQRSELEGLDRESLVARAQAAGIRRARILTRPELIDELLRLDPHADADELAEVRGFFGRARDLVARVVERGLHLPDAADRIRSIGFPPPLVKDESQALPTVTLAEIYAAQGHRSRAVETLRRVLDREPDHAAAHALLARLEEPGYVVPKPSLPPEREEAPARSERAPSAEPAPTSFEQTAESPALSFESRTVPDGVPAAALEDFPPSELPPVVLVTQPEPARAPIPAPAPPATPATAAAARAARPEKNVGATGTCLALPSLGGTYVRWAVSAAALRGWRGRAPEGRLALRVLSVTPGWDGPTRAFRDLPVESAEGQLLVRERVGVVRVAIGWLVGDAFSPIAHSSLFEATPRAIDSTSPLLRWSVEGHVPLAPSDDAAREILRTFEDARARRTSAAPV